MSNSNVFNKKTDYLDQSFDLTISQFKYSENFKNIYRAINSSIDELEDVFQQNLNLRWLDLAENAQLDVVGKIVGEARLNRSDLDYRPAILARITLNRSGGEPELIIFIAKTILGDDYIRLKEFFPGKVYIFSQTATSITQDLFDAIKTTKPAGVELILTFEENFILSDSSFLELTTTDGSILAVNPLPNFT